ncbi:hypothetical protein Phum_PHUM087320 [Pediculus humanus corporis]|uniref:Uncharacterized protein n=1 Tax=Pediculus humanus subsp. corporis TaxID=121224 RepID=E0VCI3_PEDHC|nr:uncharacterized protein Phum_PHUM087320 [Pediculus humanus corporis]EEB11089.1 hypothetical protein Phum_PHUM087320 [Pediculus humanus corporis]
MLESTPKRGNVASVIAHLEKRQKIDFSKLDGGKCTKNENFIVGGGGVSSSS